MLELNQVSTQCEGPGEAPPPGRDPWQSERDTAERVTYITNGGGPKRNTHLISSTHQGWRRHCRPPGEDASLTPDGRERQVAEGDVEGKPQKQSTEVVLT